MAYYDEQAIPAGDYAEIPAAQATSDARLAFIRRTYLHLLGAVLAFVVLETVLLTLTPLPGMMLGMLMGSGAIGWLVVLAAFMGVSWLAESWANSSASKGMQYAGLGLFVVAEAIIFVPLLAIALVVAPSAIPMAAVATVVLFGGMTASVFLTKHDFSWLGPALTIGVLAALAFIVVGIFTGFSDGLWMFFTCAMIFLACGYILYYTSNIIHHYNTNQHVAASLALFAAVALLFWYLVQLFMSRE